ncbi:hypothetical protein Cgig2_007117 [Carnegiea gigantea]|uniref:Uncharacterized protein n=1 Tax=Carnegiea gigantea TaxID=171969 RepID=A0A9Q1Q8S2_9CARY|nr:hypothetical protein Cgig2_007117 [Carnegiea gigantea]
MDVTKSVKFEMIVKFEILARETVVKQIIMVLWWFQMNKVAPFLPFEVQSLKILILQFFDEPFMIIKIKAREKNFLSSTSKVMYMNDPFGSNVTKTMVNESNTTRVVKKLGYQFYEQHHLKSFRRGLTRMNAFSGFLVAMGDLSLRKSGVEEKRVKLQESKVRKVMVELTYLKRYAPLNRVGYTPEICHEELVEMANDRKMLMIDTKLTQLDFLATEHKKRRCKAADKDLKELKQEWESVRTSTTGRSIVNLYPYLMKEL